MEARNANVSDLLNASLVSEIEAYFTRNAHRDERAVRNEVFGILNSVYRDRLHAQGVVAVSAGRVAGEVAEALGRDAADPGTQRLAADLREVA